MSIESASVRRPAPSVNWHRTSYGLLNRTSRRPLLGLHELQRHAVRFAYREVLVAVLVLERERRRQRPDALLVVLRVLRVRVDLGFLGEREARIGRELDDRFLGE